MQARSGWWWLAGVVALVLGAAGVAVAASGPAAGLPLADPRPSPGPVVLPLPGLDSATLHGPGAPSGRPGSTGPFGGPSGSRLLAVLLSFLLGLAAHRGAAVPRPRGWRLRPGHRQTAAGRAPPALQFAPSV